MKLALFDIDGTLANDQHRVPYALAEDFATYFDPAVMAQDTVWPQGRAAMAVADEMGWATGYLTGRRDSLRESTSEWLKINGFPIGGTILKMRNEDERMRLAEYKVQYLQKVLASGLFTDVMLFDDDDEVARLVSETLGEYRMFHCTWHKKEKKMMKLAKA